MIFGILLTILFILFFYLIHRLHKRNQYFKERNVKTLKPFFIFGNSYEALAGKRHPVEVVGDVYRSFPNEDVVGFLDIFPQLIIRNPDYVESVLIKDFAHFHDRLPSDGKIKNPSEANLFVLAGNTWRACRSKFSPLFTTGKLKYMYNTMADCGMTLKEVLDKKDGQEVDIADVLGHFTMDVIGSTVFGIEANVLQNPDSLFRRMGKEAFEVRFMDNIRILFFFIFPKLARLLGITAFTRRHVLDYFCNILRDTIKYRETSGCSRNDFVQMLLALKEKGKIEMQITDPADNYLIMDKSNETFELELDENILVGGAFSFLFAGYHPTAMSLTYLLFELSQAPEVVSKLRKEIKESVKGELPTYEELKGMTYCEKVLKEALRKHPVAPFLNRLCNKEYTFPNGLTIKPGEALLVPSQWIQMDPAYWAEPEVFNPDRFDTDPRPGTYLPFGEGPRICIAMRFAMLEMKLVLVELIKNYDFKLSEKTKLPVRMSPRAFVKAPKDEIILQVKKISHV